MLQAYHVLKNYLDHNRVGRIQAWSGDISRREGILRVTSVVCSSMYDNGHFGETSARTKPGCFEKRSLTYKRADPASTVDSASLVHYRFQLSSSGRT